MQHWRSRSRFAAAVALAAAVMVVAGCTGAPSRVVTGSTVTVASSDDFTSYNSATGYGATTGNQNVAYSTGAGFTYYDASGALVQDTSFGSYRKVSDDPLVVTYTIADGVKWSDGTPVDAADLLLAWIAGSGAYDDADIDPTAFTDPQTGQFTDAYPADAVFFDSVAQSGGLSLVTALPEVSDDRMSITLHYDEPYVDWEGGFFSMSSPGMPAHVVAGHALGIDDPQAAKDALITAIFTDDRAALAKISRFWNTGFALTGMPDDDDLLVSAGPYVISDFLPSQYVTLSANDEYTGARKPQFDTITIRYLPDPLGAVQAMVVGEVQVISPTPLPDVVRALGDLDVTVVSGYRDTFEHIDLMAANSASGAFSDPLVREAFLKVLPRAEIVSKLVAPVQEDATPRDSFLFLPGSDDYAAAVEANGSGDFAEVDVEGAVALLAEAGVASPSVCILYDPANARRVSEYQLIATSVAAAGFVVSDCSSENWRNVLGTPGTYDAALYGSQTVTPGISRLLAVYSTDGTQNFTGYSSPKVDDLLAQLATEQDAATRVDIQQQIDTQLWADAYGAPLFQYPAVTAFDQAKVSGVSPSIVAPGVFWNVWDWAPVKPSE